MTTEDNKPRGALDRIHQLETNLKEIMARLDALDNRLVSMRVAANAKPTHGPGSRGTVRKLYRLTEAQELAIDIVLRESLTERPVSPSRLVEECTKIEPSFPRNCGPTHEVLRAFFAERAGLYVRWSLPSKKYRGHVGGDL